MIDISWSSIRVLCIMILGVIWFALVIDMTIKEDNNNWFQSMRDRLTDSGILYVPILDKEFNKFGEEVNTYNSNEGD